MLEFLVKEYFWVIFETCFKKLENMLFVQLLAKSVVKAIPDTKTEIKGVMEEIGLTPKISDIPESWGVEGFCFQFLFVSFQLFKKYPILFKSRDIIIIFTQNVCFSTDHNCSNRGNFFKQLFPRVETLTTKLAIVLWYWDMFSTSWSIQCSFQR